MFDPVTVTGTPYEMGFQHGRAFRHVIRGNVHVYSMRHTFQGADEELNTGLADIRQAEQTHAPWVFDELRGIADGSGVEYAWIERMHLQVWGLVPKKSYTPGHGCTSIGMRAEEFGLIVGGTLDDPRQCEVLIRRLPRDGIPHIQVSWAGAAWGHNGMNAAGLSVASSSAGDVRPKPDSVNELCSISRVILQTCQRAGEALEVLKRMRTRNSFVVGDAAGQLLAFQGIGAFQAHEVVTGDLVFFTNHAVMPALKEALHAGGHEIHVEESSVARYETLTRAAAILPRTLETVKALLRSHDAFPRSICNDGTVMASVAMPQSKKPCLLVADKPPCRNEFISYVVNDDGQGT
jgi:hypothetical protein